MKGTRKIGSRYLDGLAIAEWNSRGILDSTPNDYIIKRLVITAQGAGRVDPEHDDIELVASIEVDIVSLEDGLNGDASMDEMDEGFIEMPVEVYRLPFPFNFKLRKQILRLIRDQPKMWVY